MRIVIKIILLFVLLMTPIIGKAQDNTMTKNNASNIYDNLYDIFQQIKIHRGDSLCLSLSDSMRTLAVKQGDKRAIAMSYAHPLSYYLNNGSEEQFFKCVEDLMNSSEEAELWSYYYHALNQKSVYLLRKGRLAETIEMAESMMQKAYEENNKNGIYSSHSILVNCYKQMRLYDEGIIHAEKAIQAEIGLPDNQFGNSLSRLVETYVSKYDYKGALDALGKYGHLVENTSVKVRLGEYKALCYYYLDMKEDFLQAYQDLHSLYDSYGVSNTLLRKYLPIFNRHILGKYDEARAAADSLRKRDSSSWSYLSKLYRDTGNAEELYNLLLLEESKWIEYHNELYKTDLKKYSLELDNHNLKVREQKLLEHQRDVRMYLIMALLVAMLLFGGILYILEQRSNTKLQKVNALLEDQKKQLEEQLVAVREANMANDAKTSFLFNMSHDIRTPMNAILGFADLLEKKKDDPEVVTDYIEKIKSSGRFLLSLINNVLDMARIESGKMELDEEFCDLLSTKNNTVELFSEMAKSKNITLTQSGHVDHRYVMLDQMKVGQIILNLVSNAIKYTPEGGTVKYTFEEIPCEREGYATYVSTVSDTGIGMSEEFAKNIYDMFSRERNTTESKQIGAGLGMSIVKRLVDMMGGTIELQTEQGKGTTFIVTISHKIVESPEQYLNDEHLQNETRYTESIQGKRILLAEDNDLNAEIALAVLEDAGLKVERAEDGVQCVKMLSDSAEGYYDVILMDIQMPNMDGYEATRSIRALSNKTKANIPILAMTANAFEEDARRSKEAGMNGHLSKPINVPELIRTLAINMS